MRKAAFGLQGCPLRAWGPTGDPQRARAQALAQAFSRAQRAGTFNGPRPRPLKGAGPGPIMGPKGAYRAPGARGSGQSIYSVYLYCSADFPLLLPHANIQNSVSVRIKNHLPASAQSCLVSKKAKVGIQQSVCFLMQILRTKMHRLCEAAAPSGALRGAIWDPSGSRQFRIWCPRSL